jgi:SAM-dependent methyltransferase
MKAFQSICPICQSEKLFRAEDDFYSGRDGLISPHCPYGKCATRERALAFVLRSEYTLLELRRARIHETSPAKRGIASWFLDHCPRYIQSGYFPTKPFGTMVNGIRNEDLENQTFTDGLFDLVVHLDVMEHLFRPFQALREIYRTLIPGGKCCFSTPTYHDLLNSVQVAFQLDDLSTEILGEPEYHHNPQIPEGSLVTWRYGYDLPLLISRETNFDVEVRRFQSRRAAATGFMTEIYVLSKPIA